MIACRASPHQPRLSPRRPPSLARAVPLRCTVPHLPPPLPQQKPVRSPHHPNLQHTPATCLLSPAGPQACRRWTGPPGPRTSLAGRRVSFPHPWAVAATRPSSSKEELRASPPMLEGEEATSPRAGMMEEGKEGEEKEEEFPISPPGTPSVVSEAVPSGRVFEEEVAVGAYWRKGVYPISFVLENTKVRGSRGKAKMEVDGHVIKMTSQRYQTFRAKGTQCVRCGLTGQFFAKERNNNTPKYHFNLYGFDIDGQEVLLTKDHVLPRSKGGANELDNYVPMCSPCNLAKGDSLTKRQRRDITR